MNNISLIQKLYTVQPDRAVVTDTVAVGDGVSKCAAKYFGLITESSLGATPDPFVLHTFSYQLGSRVEAVACVGEKIHSFVVETGHLFFDPLGLLPAGDIDNFSFFNHKFDWMTQYPEIHRASAEE
jgi:hypothetical protein